MREPPEIQISADADSLTRDAAAEVVRLAAEAHRRRGRFTLALAGGSTPLALYRLLASSALRQAIDWVSTDIFWGDERAVPPDHPRSNYGTAREALLSHLALPRAQVHRIQGELGATGAAKLYEEELRGHFPDRQDQDRQAPDRQSLAPALDLILLGLGDDGHTASLFPHHKALQETELWVVPVRDESLPESRVTLTLPLINRARHVLFLVSGATKAVVVREILEGRSDTQALPAQGVQPVAGRLIWRLDRPAAGELTGE